ncbi:MAG TPA: pseudouridine synthase [Terriglobia bacterium]|nr:pseudouridine synthase [Terriglobia bacterium]
MKSKRVMTLDRLLSRFGVTSRSVARKAIAGGRVRLNGRVVRDPECWVTPGKDTVQLDGQRLRPERKVYLLFYKPKGVIVSRGDPSGRKTVYDCLAEAPRPDDQAGSRMSATTPYPAPRRGGEAERAGRGTARNGRAANSRPSASDTWLAPVGRLDKDTSGLLILTNDTAFAHFVTCPETKVRKTYRVKLSGLMDNATIAQLAEGVQMKRGDEARPVSARRLEDRGKYTWLEVVLTEGKNREVRRMVEAVGFKVLKLVRTAIGPLTLEGLEVGRWRALTAEDLAALRNQRQVP